jgi:hypothetical protein
LILSSLLVTWLLVELVLRLALPGLPPFLQFIVEQVRPMPFAGMPAPVPDIYQSDDRYGNVVAQDRDNPLRRLVPGQAFHVMSINWLAPPSKMGFRVPAAGWQPRLVIWQWYDNDFNEDYGLIHSGDTGVTAPVFPDDTALSPLAGGCCVTQPCSPSHTILPRAGNSRRP